MTVTVGLDFRATFTIVPPDNEQEIKYYWIYSSIFGTVCNIPRGQRTCVEEVHGYARRLVFKGSSCYNLPSGGYTCGREIIKEIFTPPKCE